MLYSYQPVYCQICGKVINISGYYDGRVCGPECWKEFNWRKVSSLLGKEYQEKDPPDKKQIDYKELEQRLYNHKATIAESGRKAREQIDKLLKNSMVCSTTPTELEKEFGGLNCPISEHEAGQIANERMYHVEKKIVSIIKESDTNTKGISPTYLLNNFDGTNINQSEARGVMERMIDSGKLWVDKNLMIHYYDWKGPSI